MIWLPNILGCHSTNNPRDLPLTRSRAESYLRYFRCCRRQESPFATLHISCVPVLIVRITHRHSAFLCLASRQPSMFLHPKKTPIDVFQTPIALGSPAPREGDRVPRFSRLRSFTYLHWLESIPN